MFLTALNIDGDSGSAFWGIIIFGVCMAVYFIPSIIARNKRNYNSITALNFFLGWTLVGWVVALCWALMDDAPPSQAATHSTLCSGCGKYSQGGSKFCPNCGHSLGVTQGA
jgi:Superinfection immunity protein